MKVDVHHIALVVTDWPSGPSRSSSSGGIFFLDPDGLRLEIAAEAAGEGRPAPSGSLPSCGFF